MDIMPQVSKFKLAPLHLGKETLGERIARFRKEKGYTQVELAQKIGINQVLLSAYERGRLRPHYEMVIRLALALNETTDDLLGVKQSKMENNNKPNRSLLRRMKKIEELPPIRQKFIIKTIDSLIKAAEK
jgi:transcriptional regulator with XRE-family HTH domain